MAKKKAKQEELPGMPEMDALGAAATEFLNERQAHQEQKDCLDLAKAKLVAEFIKSGKSSIKVSGYTLNYMRKEAESIVVKEE